MFVYFESRMLKFLFILYCLIFVSVNPYKDNINIEDNDFAEFEDEESTPSSKVLREVEDKEDSNIDSQAVEAGEEDLVSVENEDEEDYFEHLNNEDEFEGFDKDKKQRKPQQQPDLKIIKVPAHMGSSWDSFYMEMLMLAGLTAYILNYIAGRTKNQKIAETWFSTNKTFLEENFTVVGDDGTGTDVQNGILMKEAENIYQLWCTGRTSCQGLLITLKLLKRQDLISSITRLFKSANDQIIFKVMMNETDMDPFVFCLANKKLSTKLQKDHTDIANFCMEKKSGEKLDLPSSLQVLSESNEVSTYILDAKVVSRIKKYENLLDYFHFSDQHSAPKPVDEVQTGKLPEINCVLLFSFNMSDDGYGMTKDFEQMKQFLQIVFYLTDKIKRFKLSKDAKLKADRSRQKLIETLQKASHQQRSEAAQNRKEEKRRVEKEKVMNEDDPEKQKKLEEKNLKKEAKKKQLKVKRLKMKAM